MKIRLLLSQAARAGVRTSLFRNTTLISSRQCSSIPSTSQSISGEITQYRVGRRMHVQGGRDQHEQRLFRRDSRPAK